ncbi:TonB-dependent receptor [Delftia sp. PS-11]|uniref:TonB-dependent receptor n=1 Tax=Delftia sp. PS-11 TaxID=2767222 RepID=UPI003AB80129
MPVHQIAAASLLGLAAMPHAGAQDAEARLQAVEVKGQAARGAAAAYTTTVMESDDVADAHVSQPQELLRKVPGMAVNSYQLSGVGDAIVLRGFGGGGHGGDVGVALDGIALNEAMSHADGYVDLNVIIPLEIERLTVYKGPVSALYGNFNRAGLIAIDTRKQGEYRQVDWGLASHGTLDAQAALGLKLSEGEFLNLAAQQWRSDGFRAQSASQRSTAALRWSRQITPALEVALSARLHHAEGDSPGYVTAAQFATDPYGKDPRAMNDGARKDFATLRADTRYALSPQLSWLAFAYTTRQSFTRWFSRPVSTAQWRQREESYERTVYGVGTSLNGRHVTALTPIHWVAGLESLRESTDYLYYDGLLQRERTAPAINDRDSRLNSLSAYAEVDAPIHRLLQLSAGLRWDRFTGDCLRNGPETGADPCGPLARTSHASPKLGLRSQVAPGVLLRASWSEGFALASNFAKYALGAAQLEPNIFRQTEVGAQFRPVAGLVLDVAAYRLLSSQEIRNTAPGVYENYGATRRTGAEASVQWAVRRDLDLEVAWGSARSRVTENGNPSLVGRQVAGVPRHTATVALAWRPVPRWQGTLAWRHVGRYAVNADNSVSYGGYATWDLGLGYSLPGSRSRIYATVSNLTDKAYATSSSIIGGTQLFAPGAPRTLKVGVQAHF